MPRPRTKQPSSKLSAAVASLRKAMGLTQPVFAKLLGVTLVTVARWETNRPPAGDALVRLKKLSGQALENARLDPNLSADRDRELLAIDDTFYSALVQEFDIYRLGLVGTIQTGISVILRELLDAATAQPEGQLKASLIESARKLQQLSAYVNMFDPLQPPALPAAQEDTQ